jgi:hypothetical protein
MVWAKAGAHETRAAAASEPGIFIPISFQRAANVRFLEVVSGFGRLWRRRDRTEAIL